VRSRHQGERQGPQPVNVTVCVAAVARCRRMSSHCKPPPAVATMSLSLTMPQATTAICHLKSPSRAVVSSRRRRANYSSKLLLRAASANGCREPPLHCFTIQAATVSLFLPPPLLLPQADVTLPSFSLIPSRRHEPPVPQSPTEPLLCVIFYL